jgi:hypothetical protein
MSRNAVNAMKRLAAALQTATEFQSEVFELIATEALIFFQTFSDGSLSSNADRF